MNDREFIELFKKQLDKATPETCEIWAIMFNNIANLKRLERLKNE